MVKNKPACAGRAVLISGIQPSGRMHLGNYLGSLKNFVVLQNSGKYNCYFFIADLHSLTENYNPREKQKQIIDLMADYLAVGLDSEKSVIFLQSQVPAHSELAWILNTITPMGELTRMTQFKSKAFGSFYGKEGIPTPTEKATEYTKKVIEEVIKRSESIANAGLLVYPTLMAADILLYDAQFVPVGEDQIQHLELTRTLARKFNSRFGKTFVEPKEILTEVPRLMSLNNPEKKMSKSDPASCLFMDDSPEEIKRKIKEAVTDSGSEIKYDPEKKPAISNLIDIYSSLSGIASREIELKFKGKGYANFKKELADVSAGYFANYRTKKTKLLKNPGELKELLLDGSKKANKIATAKILEIKEKIGILIS